MAQTAAQKIENLQSELDAANDRIAELEDYLRDGSSLLAPEDLEEVLDEIQTDDEE